MCLVGPCVPLDHTHWANLILLEMIWYTALATGMHGMVVTFAEEGWWPVGRGACTRLFGGAGGGGGHVGRARLDPLCERAGRGRRCRVSVEDVPHAAVDIPCRRRDSAQLHLAEAARCRLVTP